MARQKKGVALIFLPYIREDVALGKLTIIPVVDGEIKLGIDIVTNPEMPASPMLKAFMGLIEKHFSYFLSGNGS